MINSFPCWAFLQSELCEFLAMHKGVAELRLIADFSIFYA